MREMTIEDYLRAVGAGLRGRYRAFLAFDIHAWVRDRLMDYTLDYVLSFILLVMYLWYIGRLLLTP